MGPLLDELSRATARLGIGPDGTDDYRLILNADGADELADAMSSHTKNPAKDKKIFLRNVEMWRFMGIPVVLRENAAQRWRFEPNGEPT